MSPDVLLAMLLFAQAPGRSPHAKIFLDTCDDQCQQTRRCDEPFMYCRAPLLSPRHRQFYRYETWEEGVKRYALIADVVVDLLLTTVMSYESSLRRDVHEGRSRGDCDYTTVAGTRTVIAGSCRSHCLGQVMVRRGQRTSRGYTSDELVGLDRASTARCVQTVIDRLSGANNACVAQHAGGRAAYPACTMGVYGGVASWAMDPRISARAKTFHTLANLPTELDAKVKQTLGRAP